MSPERKNKNSWSGTRTNQSYRIWYDDQLGAMYVKIFSALTKEDAKVVFPLVNRILVDKPKRMLMVDLTDVPIQEMVDKESRKAFRESSDPRNFERIAVFGASPAMRMIAKIILTVTGVSKVARFFSTHDEAAEWITQGKNDEVSD